MVKALVVAFVSVSVSFVSASRKRNMIDQIVICCSTSHPCHCHAFALLTSADVQMCRCAENNTGCNNILPGWIESLVNWKVEKKWAYQFFLATFLVICLTVGNCNSRNFSRDPVVLSCRLTCDVWISLPQRWSYRLSVCLPVCLPVDRGSTLKTCTVRIHISQEVDSEIRTQMPRTSICEVGRFRRSGNPRYNKFRFLEIFQRNLKY